MASNDDKAHDFPRQPFPSLIPGWIIPRHVTNPIEDAETVLGGRTLRVLPGNEDIEDPSDGPDEVILLGHGCALLSVLTPFGPHPIDILHAPIVMNLGRALAGTTDLCVFSPEPESEAIVLSSDEAIHLLKDASAAGQAFRRLALLSVSSMLRLTNAALSRFFDTGLPRVGPPAQASSAPKGARRIEVDHRRMQDIFDAAGIDPKGLPDLGISALQIPGGSALLTAGTPGEEAYLLSDGQLRVEMSIPGVGREALAFLNAGEFVGEMALIEDAPRSADVFAHGGSAVVFSISRKVFRHLLESGLPAGAPLLAGITMSLARRLDEALRRAAAFRVLSGPF